MDPGGLCWHLPRSLPGNSGHQVDHLRRVQKGGNQVPEGDTYHHLHQHPYNVPGLGSPGCVSGGAQKKVQKDRDRDGLPPSCQHSVEPDVSWPTVVHRSVKYSL